MEMSGMGTIRLVPVLLKASEKPALVRRQLSIFLSVGTQTTVAITVSLQSYQGVIVAKLAISVHEAGKYRNLEVICSGN